MAYIAYRLFSPDKKRVFIQNRKDMKHQIILIGKEISSVYHGIKEFGPDFIHLLCTDETVEFPEQMYPLLPKSIKRKIYIVEPFDAESVIKVCREIHNTYEGEFAYNLSEGTKLMAFAAYRVASEMDAFSFYLSQQGELIDVDTFEKREICCSLENEEMIQLYGNEVDTYHDCKNLIMSVKIRNFIEEHHLEYKEIQRYFSLFCKRKIDRLPAFHQFPDKLCFKQRNGRLIISRKDRILLKLGYEDGCFLFFEGRWWETLVAEKVYQWSSRQEDTPQVWQSVVFLLNDDPEKKTKNEVDVLLNNHQEMIFIECKSGKVSQNDIYKIDAVRETYGGDISHAVLASYHPVDADIKEKSEDLQINIFAPPSTEERKYFIENLPEWLDQLNDEILI